MDREPAGHARLVPELDVSSLDASLEFYTGVCGFALWYRRDDEQFAYLDLDGANLMLQAADGPGRRFRTAALERPHGRGVNLQIEVDAVEPLYGRVIASAAEVIVPIEERSYGLPDGVVRSRQFVVADPDGYLLRFFQDLADATSSGSAPD